MAEKPVNSTKGKWFYSGIVKDHFFNPRNILKSEKEIKEFKADGVGVVGNPRCGDVMKVWVKIDKEQDKIVDCKWQTFGCASAIASTSMLSVMVTENGGMPVEKALKLAPKEIVDRLGGLPALKFHCSVLGERALKEALNDYFKKTGQCSRIVKEK